MAKKRFYEVNNPKPDKEYWVVVDEERCLPHYFTNETYARAYANEFGHTIIFQECFN